MPNLAESVTELATSQESIETELNAALMHEKSGNFIGAAALYEALDMHADAGRCYEEAAKSYTALMKDTRRKSIKVMKDAERANQAAAAAIREVRDDDCPLERGGNKIARLDQQARTYSNCSIGAWTKAAEMYEAIDMHADAGRCYEEAEEWIKAIEMYLKAEEWDQATEIHRNIPADFINHVKVGKIYEGLEKWDEAAKMYERACKFYYKNDISKFSDEYKECATKAAKMYEKAGDLTKAARIYEENGDLSKFNEIKRCINRPKNLKRAKELENSKSEEDLREALDIYQSYNEDCEYNDTILMLYEKLLELLSREIKDYKKEANDQEDEKLFQSILGSMVTRLVPIYAGLITYAALTESREKALEHFADLQRVRDENRKHLSIVGETMNFKTHIRYTSRILEKKNWKERE